LGRDCEQEFTKVEEFKDESNISEEEEEEEDRGKEKTYFQKCLDLYLKPIAIEISTVIKFDDCWTGSYCTFARTKKTKEIFACGLNNYFQLNIDPKGDDRTKNENLIIKEFTKWKGLPKKEIKSLFVNSVASGEHHSLFICNNGSLFSIGNHNYGRLGLGNIKNDIEHLSLSPVFNNENKIKKISTSASSVLGISYNNKLYGWGMADCHQITFKNDTYIPTLIQTNGDVIDCAVGAQHSLFIVKNNL
jgi:regulator of chromosome condensation